jgi:hypothetical protein
MIQIEIIERFLAIESDQDAIDLLADYYDLIVNIVHTETAALIFIEHLLDEDIRINDIVIRKRIMPYFSVIVNKNNAYWLTFHSSIGMPEENSFTYIFSGQPFEEILTIIQHWEEENDR